MSPLNHSAVMTCHGEPREQYMPSTSPAVTQRPEARATRRVAMHHAGDAMQLQRSPYTAAIAILRAGAGRRPARRAAEEAGLVMRAERAGGAGTLRPAPVTGRAMCAMNGGYGAILPAATGCGRL
jgi:hypothetical protein